ncbi:MAG: GatB/YqeY domain-containing protein [Planctomycetota bacterium]|nr:GatB/YqeY domain-containing protein [Planctomycetota bacterium]
MLKDEMKRQMLEAMKAKRTVEKDVLRVALGEIQTIESRSGQDATDEEIGKVLRKLIKSNEESLAASDDAAKRATLEEENGVLGSLLPKTLSPEEIVAALEPVKDAVLGAGNDGQATGVAMKHLKSTGAAVDGKDVNAAVRAMRA